MINTLQKSLIRYKIYRGNEPLDKVKFRFYGFGEASFRSNDVHHYYRLPYSTSHHYNYKLGQTRALHWVNIKIQMCRLKIDESELR